MANFMDPHDVPIIPGIEGWERMYPYQYLFSREDPERAKYESDAIWYYDGLHYPEPHYPFDLLWDEYWALTLSQYNTRHWIIPSALGIDHRIVNGYVYISPVGIADPNEIPKRVPHFMERASYYYNNWDKLYGNWKTKILDVLKRLEAMNFTDLPEMEDMNVIKDGVGLGSGYHLLTGWDNLINVGLQCWQYHFEMLNLAYAAQVTFFATGNQIFPDVPVSTLVKMSAGMEADLFKSEGELVKLSKLIIELGIDELFLKPLKADALIAELEKIPAGQKWLKAFEEARYPWFYISTGTGWFHTHISWNDNLNIPFESMRTNVKALKAGKQIGRKPAEEMIKERDKIVKAYRDLIRSEEDKEAFDQTVAIAQKVLPYAENHTFYVEHWFHSVFWQKVRQVGTILKNAGFFEDAEDIWYLKRDEIKQALWDYSSAWATGIKARGPSYWPKEVAWRKGVLEKMRTWTPPPALGTRPDVVTEPFTIVQWGVTSETLDKWLAASEDGDQPSDLIKGNPGSSGVVRGPAHVLRNVDELADLQEGEILVATTTSPSWAPSFAKIKGCVTDVGGPMCHAAIVCREYNLPTVVGTGKGSQLIKSGDLIEIDGDAGTVKILQRAK